MSFSNSFRVVLVSAFVWAASLFVVSFGIRLLIFQVNLASGNQLDPFFGGYFHAMLVGPASGGALAGYVTARLLKRYAHIPSMRVLPIVLAFAFAMLLVAVLPLYLGPLLVPPEPPQPLYGEVESQSSMMMRQISLIFVRDFLFWIIPGSLGGLQLASEMRRSGLKLGGTGIFKISAGWGFGFALGGSVGITVISLITGFWLSSVDVSWLGLELIAWMQYGIAGLLVGAIGAWVTVRVIRSALRPLSNIVPDLQT